MWRIWLSVAVGSVLALPILAWLIVAVYGAYNKIKTKECTSKLRLDGKTALVTGGTAGIGLEVATEFARSGARVIIACPFQQEGENAQKHIINTTGNKNIIFQLLNLASLSSTRAFAEEIMKTEERLDILVNNAGVIMPDKLTADGLHFVMQVNYYGMFLLTILLLPLLKKTGLPLVPSRIVNVSSLSHRQGQVTFGKQYRKGVRVYFDSKLCSTIFVRELAKKLCHAAVTNVVVNTSDPGVVATGIADNYNIFVRLLRVTLTTFYPTAVQGAQTTLHVSVDERIANVSGEYYKNCEQIEPSRKAYDTDTANRLWEETVQIVKLSPEEVMKCFKN